MNEKMYKFILGIRAIPKTIWFNFKYLPIRDAIKFPVIISHRVALQRMDGNIEFAMPIKFGMVHIGFHENPSFDRRLRTIWNNKGTVAFLGSAYMGNGTAIANSGCLQLGSNFSISGNSTIICKEKISFDDDVLIGWNCIFMDGDAHKVYSTNNVWGGERLNHNRPIAVGKHVWIGAECKILKGTVIPDGCIIAANTCIYKRFDEENCIIGGYPAKIIKKDIWWEG